MHQARGDAAAIRERAKATAEGIEMLSKAMARQGGAQAANLRVAEQWVTAWKASRSMISSISIYEMGVL